MTLESGERGTDLEMLRGRYPGWFFTTIWVAAGSGPDRRLLAAQRAGVVLSDLTVAGLTAKIERESGRPLPRDLF